MLKENESMKDKSLTRRDFLRLTGLAILGATSACQFSKAGPATKLQASTDQLSQTDSTATVQTSLCQSFQTEPTATPQASVTPQPRGKKRVLRIAHMTDFHAQPEGNAPDGIRRALRHAQSQKDPPDIIFNTGDSIMDSLQNADKGAVEAQWETFTSILKSEANLPVMHAIGNHDVWGWGVNSSAIKKDPLFGKAMALEKLGLEMPYYSFDRAGWHFVVIDSTHLPNKVSKYPYIGMLDEEQFQWLVNDINRVAMTSNMPICIISHIPILAACEYFDGPNEESGNWVVPGSWIHIDARRFRDYFVQTASIHLCLSGHTHQYESLDYLHVRYMTDGAVCGNWWNGDYLEFPPAYVMVNLYDDGTADSYFVPYDKE
jgi:3',5'-cyclic-AMP phosphodiesterase